MSRTMILHDILRVLDELAPLRYAEAWDNVGLIVGDPGVEVKRVLVTVDYAPEVAEEARALGAELVVSYHPPLFGAVKRIPHDAPWADAVRRGIALYSPHTALDVVADGTNDVLASACGVPVAGRRPLRAFAGLSLDVGGEADPAGIGLGRIGEIAPASLGSLVERIKGALGLEHVLVAGALDRNVSRVAVAAGAGGELLPLAVLASADLFVTGELRHHDVLAARARGVAVIATLHSNSERRAVSDFRARIAARLDGVDVRSSAVDADPLVVR